MDTAKLIDILKIQTFSYQQFRMFAFLIREIKKQPACVFVVRNGNIYITKGKAKRFPCLVAHMDTVHKITEDLAPLQVGTRITGFNRSTMRQSGIGGDDKIGIFIALECLQRFDYLKIVFFRDEEVGCKGSYEADLDFFENCNFILQCDRMGRNDFITEACGVSLSSQDFQNTVRELLCYYQYSFASGMMTDVLALVDIGVGCSTANISCGYYHPHTDHEYVNIEDVENCLELVTSIISRWGNTYFPHQTDGAPYFFENNFCLNCLASHPESNGYCMDCNAYLSALLSANDNRR